MTEIEIGFLKEELERVKNEYGNLLEENSRLKKDLSSKVESQDLEHLELQNKELRELHDSTVKLKDEEIKQIKKDLKKRKGESTNGKAEAERAKTELELIKKVISSKDFELTDLKDKNVSCQAKVESLEKEIQMTTAYKKQNEQSQKEIESLGVKLTKACEDKSALIGETNKLSTKLGSVKAELEALQKAEDAKDAQANETETITSQPIVEKLDTMAYQIESKFNLLLMETVNKSKGGRKTQKELQLREVVKIKEDKIGEQEEVIALLKGKLKELADKLRNKLELKEAQPEVKKLEEQLRKFTVQLYAKSEEAKVLRKKHKQAANFCSNVSKGFDNGAKAKFKQVARFCDDVAEGKLDLTPERGSRANNPTA